MATPVLRQAVVHAVSTSGTTCVATYGSAPVTGDTLLVISGAYGGATLIDVSSISITNGTASFSKIVSQPGVVNSYGNAEAWIAYNVTITGTPVVTVNYSGTVVNADISIYDWENVSSVEGTPGNGTATITSGKTTLPALTTTNATDVLFALVDTDGSISSVDGLSTWPATIVFYESANLEYGIGYVITSATVSAKSIEFDVTSGGTVGGYIQFVLSNVSSGGSVSFAGTANPKFSPTTAPLTISREYGSTTSPKFSPSTAALLVTRPFGGSQSSKFNGSGTLLVSRKFPGTGNPKFNGSGGLTISRQFAGNAQAKINSPTTALVVSRNFAGTTNPRFSPSSTPLLIPRQFGGTANPKFNGTGTLTVTPTTVAFAGTSNPKFSGSGVLTVTRPFAATTHPKFSGSGALTITRKLGGTSSPVFNGSGALTISRQFSGTTGYPYLVTVPIPTGQVQPTSYVINGLPASPITTGVQTNGDGSVQLNYSLVGVPRGSYTVTVTAYNGGVPSSPSSNFSLNLGYLQTNSTGALTSGANFGGTCHPKFNGSGNLKVTRPFAGSAQAKFNGSGQLTTGAGFAGTSNPKFNGSGALTVLRKFGSTVTAKFNGTGILTISRQITGTTNPRFNGSGSLTVGSPPLFFAGTVHPKFNGSAALTIPRSFGGTAHPKASISTALVISRPFGGTGRPTFDGSGQLTVGNPTVSFGGTCNPRFNGSGALTVEGDENVAFEGTCNPRFTGRGTLLIGTYTPPTPFIGITVRLKR